MKKQVSGKRLLLIAFLVVALGGAGYGAFQLQDAVSQGGTAGECINDPNELEGPGTGPAPRPLPPLCPGWNTAAPVCAWDETGLPTEDSDPLCGLVAPCEGCPLPGVPRPTPKPSLLRDNPAAELTAPPVHQAGDAAALGRSDCPNGWQAAVSDTTGMSVCFPGDIGKIADPITAEEFQFGQHHEDRLDITLSGRELPAIASINIVRSAGVSGPLFLDCDEPQGTQLLGSPAKVCIWPEGKDEVWEAVTPVYAISYLIEKSGFQWVFVAVILGLPGEPTGDISSLKGTTAEVLETLRLP